MIERQLRFINIRLQIKKIVDETKHELYATGDRLVSGNIVSNNSRQRGAAKTCFLLTTDMKID